jgi:hypothetical protein
MWQAYLSLVPAAVYLTHRVQFLFPTKSEVPFANHHSQDHPITDKRFSTLCPYLRNRFLAFALPSLQTNGV